MNIKVKCRLILLFSLMIFGGWGMNAQVNAASDDSTTVADQSQSINKSDSSITVNVTEWTSNNDPADEESDSAAATVDDSKVKQDSGGSVTTTYGDAKDNQVKANRDKDATQDGPALTTTSSSFNDSSQPSVEKDESSDDSTTIALTSSVPDSDGEPDTNAPEENADKDASKVVTPVIDQLATGVGKLSTDDQTVTAAGIIDGPVGSLAILSPLDTSKFSQTQETFGIPDQPIIESHHVHNDVVGDTFADKVTKSDPKKVKEVTATANNKTKLLTFNAFSDTIYRHVLKTAQKPGTITTEMGHKVTLTTPVNHVKYMEHDSTSISETLPVVAALVIIGVAGIAFMAFDPLRFLFK